MRAYIGRQGRGSAAQHHTASRAQQLLTRPLGHLALALVGEKPGRVRRAGASGSRRPRAARLGGMSPSRPRTVAEEVEADHLEDALALATCRRSGRRRASRRAAPRRRFPRPPRGRPSSAGLSPRSDEALRERPDVSFPPGGSRPAASPRVGGGRRPRLPRTLAASPAKLASQRVRRLLLLVCVDRPRRHDALRGARAAPAALRGRVRALEGPPRGCSSAPTPRAPFSARFPAESPRRATARAAPSSMGLAPHGRGEPRLWLRGLRPDARHRAPRPGGRERALVGRGARLARRRDAAGRGAGRCSGPRSAPRSSARCSARPSAPPPRRRPPPGLRRRSPGLLGLLCLGAPNAAGRRRSRKPRARSRACSAHRSVLGALWLMVHAGAPLRRRRRARPPRARATPAGARPRSPPRSSRQPPSRRWSRLWSAASRTGAGASCRSGSRSAAHRGHPRRLPSPAGPPPSSPLLVAAAITFGAFWAPAMALLSRRRRAHRAGAGTRLRAHERRLGRRKLAGPAARRRARRRRRGRASRTRSWRSRARSRWIAFSRGRASLALLSLRVPENP